MPNPIPELETVSAKDLLTRPIVPLEYTIDAILPHGLFILAGSSKVGKSWLALDMSCAVVSGGSLWQYSATQGDVLYLLEGMAEYYSVELSQKIRRGMALNAKKCLCTGAGLSLGYSIDENKRYVVNEGEAVIVRKIYEMYLAGSTMADIIRYLNANGVKTRLGKRQKEKAELEAQLAMEKIQRPVLKYEQIRFFFERFLGGDADDINYRRALVDTFISKIYLYDDRMVIVYNAQDGGQIECPISELCGSPMGQMVEARGVEPLSEDTSPTTSPSADGSLDFPFPGACRQAPGFGSFIKSHRLQSLDRLVPHLLDAQLARRGYLAVNGRCLSSDSD